MWTVQQTYVDPGAGTGLAEHASAGPGARVVSTEVSPGQVLPGLQTPRLGGPLGPSGSSRFPLSLPLYHMLMRGAGLDCRLGRRPAGPGYRGRSGPSLPQAVYDPRAWEPAH